MKTQTAGYQALHTCRLAFLLAVILLLLPACTPHPQPARVEEITFQSGEFTLVGDLRLPEGTGPFPLVILVHGSGPTDRTGEGSYFPIMERMAQAGYATFSWDKPGTDESTGVLSEPYLRHQRAQIVLDAIEVMKARSDIDPQRIGLWGGSQAGYVMPLVLAQSEEVAFMICVSCPGMSGVDQTTYGNMARALCTGTPEDQAERRTELLAELDAARTYETYDEYVHYREVIDALFGTAPDTPQGYRFEVVPEEEWQANNPENERWWNPIEVVEQVTIPVLAIFGETDLQIDPIQGVHAYQDALAQAGNPLSRVELFPAANHGIVVSETGCPADDLQRYEQYARSLGYGSLDEALEAIHEDPYNPVLSRPYPYAPGYLDLIEEWLRDLRR